MFAVVVFDDFALSSFTSPSSESSERDDVVFVRRLVDDDCPSVSTIDSVGVPLFEFFESREVHFCSPLTTMSVEDA